MDFIGLPPEQEDIAGVIVPLQHTTVVVHSVHQILLVAHIIYLQKMKWDRSVNTSAIDVAQQHAVSGNGLLDLFFCGFVHD